MKNEGFYGNSHQIFISNYLIFKNIHKKVIKLIILLIKILRNSEFICIFATENL